jgi:hypothetical protein
VAPETSKCCKTGTYWWGRFLAPKTRNEMLKRTIRIRFLFLDFGTIFGTRKWAPFSYRQRRGGPLQSASLRLFFGVPKMISNMSPKVPVSAFHVTTLSCAVRVNSVRQPRPQDSLAPRNHLSATRRGVFACVIMGGPGAGKEIPGGKRAGGRCGSRYGTMLVPVFGPLL